MFFHVFTVNHPAFGVSQGNPPAFQAKKAAEDQATKLATEEAQEEAKEGALSKGFLSMAVVATKENWRTPHSVITLVTCL